MLDDTSSRVALTASLLLHAALAAPIYERVIPALGGAPAASAVPERPPIRFSFVDEQPNAEPPDAPTDLVATTDARAAQPDAPPLPRGAAYAEGTAPVPTTPRRAGAPDAGLGGRGDAETRRPAVPAAAAERPPAREGAGPAADRRLALPRDPIDFRRGRPAPPGASAMAVPQVDSRLTSAASGSDFSMNTTAWEWAPYIARLKRAIEAHIAPPAAFYYGTAAWVTRVRFRIEPDGRLSALELIDHRGVVNLQHVAVDAIENAADFEPLPPDFPEDRLEIVGNFYFNVMPEDGR